MAKKTEKKKKFKGAVGRNSAKQAQGTQASHLKLPKGVTLFKEDAKSRIELDILPYEVTTEFHPDRDDEYDTATPGSLWYKRPYWLHRNLGTNNDTVVCPSSVKQKCPICEYRAKLLKEGADWNDDSVKALKASQRNLYVVIPKGNKAFEEKIHIWDISQFLFQAKLNEEVQENEEYESFPDLEEGYSLRIRFSEESFGTNKYADTSRIDFIERKKPYNESILEKVPALDDLLNIKPYNIISTQFFGNMTSEEAAEEEDDDEEEDVVMKKPAIPKKKAPIVEEEDDDDDEDDEDDEDADDDDDEDEEEEIAPPPSRKASPAKTPAPPAKEVPKASAKKEKETPAKAAPPAPAAKAKAPEKAAKTSKGKGCPHGHTFGKDIDEHSECDSCAVWDDCMDNS